MSQIDNTVKIVLLGPSGVGKSSIVLRYVNQYFREEQDLTVGAIFMSKTLIFGDKHFKFQIWDTAGQEKYRALAKKYYQDVTAALLVYDITNNDSFNDLENWHSDLIEKSSARVIKIVIGNKIDLKEKEVIEISRAQQYANDINANYYRTSAKIGDGIDDAFQEIARQVTEIAKEEAGEVRSETFMLKTPRALDPALKKKMCC